MDEIATYSAAQVKNCDHWSRYTRTRLHADFSSNSPVNFQCYCINKSHTFCTAYILSLIYLYSPCLVAHCAFSKLLHYSRPAVIVLVSFYDPPFAYFRSFFNSRSPLLLRPSSSLSPLCWSANNHVTVITMILLQDLTNHFPSTTLLQSAVSCSPFQTAP